MQIKLAEVFELVSLRYLLIDLIWKLVLLPMIFALFLLIRTMTCFLEGPFMVILIFSLTRFDLLMISLISTIFLGDVVGNMFLMQMMSSMLIFEACIYDFLLDSVISLPLFDIAGLGNGVDLEALGATGVKNNEIH